VRCADEPCVTLVDQSLLPWNR